jgi:hypothetical protein
VRFRSCRPSAKPRYSVLHRLFPLHDSNIETTLHPDVEIDTSPRLLGVHNVEVKIMKELHGEISTTATSEG